MPNARAALTAQRMFELDLQSQLAAAKLERDVADKQLAKDEWLSRWGLPLGGTVGIVVGLIVGVVAARR